VILVLGGTGEARELAAALHEHGLPVTTSLAGRVTRPRLPPGEVRIGGFGGPDRLADWLRAHNVSRVIDATHPFAERISASARTACTAAGVPLLRLERPGFSERPGDRWHWVEDLESAAVQVAEGGERVLLTTGRQGLEAFAALDAWFLIRCVEEPGAPLPARHEIVLDRGPYTLEGELALLDRHRIDMLVTKDSGGSYTAAKLDAARARGLAVIVVRRPGRPAAQRVSTVEQALAWASTDAAQPAHPG
jgi:precorrin-6A/cobalt-precorrin-6A reductase